MEDNAAIIGERMPFLSGFRSDEFGISSFSDLTQDGNQVKSPAAGKHDMIMKIKDEESETRVQFPSASSSEARSLSVQKSSMRGGLAERIAARASFNFLTVNTDEIRQVNFSSSTTDVWSPYVMIPPGLSPATLLNSPVLLSNSLVESSPTTGSFPMMQWTNNSLVCVLGTPDKKETQTVEDNDPQLFSFQPLLESNSCYTSCAENKADSTSNHQHSLPSIKEQAQTDCPAQTNGIEARMQCQYQQDFNIQDGLYDSTSQKDTTDKIMLHQSTAYPILGKEHSPTPNDPQDIELQTKGEVSSLAVGAPAEDGYNWRKYGQKQVKGSEFPRSYYKCTYPNCPVKKKVERSHEGHITEIIYKGTHNHPKLSHDCHSGVPCSHSFSNMQIKSSEHHGSQSGPGGEQPFKVNVQNGTLPPSLPAEFCETSTSMPIMEDCTNCEIKDAIDVSSTLPNNKDEATHGSMSLGCDGEGDETQPKRRKLDAGTFEMSAPSKVVREPRVVVQTTSEVDVLDDGYRWRKYGQKVVKGNPNPRSYYKCTNPGCTVRKHVERASHDLKSVITTYEGKHNHGVPAARNNCQASCGSSTAPPTSAPQPQSLHRRPQLAQMQEKLARPDWPPPVGKAGVFGRDQLAPSTCFPLRIDQGLAMNLAMAGLGPLASMQMPVPPSGHSYLRGHFKASEVGFMALQGEPREKPVSESILPAPSHGLINNQMRKRVPLGPQL